MTWREKLQEFLREHGGEVAQSDAQAHSILHTVAEAGRDAPSQNPTPIMEDAGVVGTGLAVGAVRAPVTIAARPSDADVSDALMESALACEYLGTIPGGDNQRWKRAARTNRNMSATLHAGQ